jgi:hypothetical protein
VGVCGSWLPGVVGGWLELVEVRSSVGHLVTTVLTGILAVPERLRLLLQLSLSSTLDASAETAEVGLHMVDFLGELGLVEAH